jgi:hypothetical protein
VYNNSKNQKKNLKVAMIGILIVAILLSYNSYGLALADPAHCDRAGFPSCYDVGFGDGQANPGTSCPGGHSARFCEGWDAGANSGGSSDSQSNLGNTGTDTSGSTAGTSQINWEGLCNQYHDMLGLKAPCSTYAQGTQLTPAGQQALLCLGGGAVTTLASLVNPSNSLLAKGIQLAGQKVCP